MVDINPQWQSVTTYLGAAYSLKQDDKLPDYILALTKGTLAYEQAIKAAWIDFKRNPTEANAQKFASFLKTYSGKHWPEVVKSVLGVSTLSPQQQKMLEDALGEHHEYVMTSLLPDMLKAASADNLNAMDHRAIFLYAGALWSFGLLATVMFDGLEVRDLADLFLFAGPNDAATCKGERGCEQYAGKVFTVAQILADNIVPGKLRCVTNCRHMLLPVASPLNKPKVPKQAMDYGQWQSEFKHLEGRHNQLDHGRKGYGTKAKVSDNGMSIFNPENAAEMFSWYANSKGMKFGQIKGLFNLKTHEWMFTKATAHYIAVIEFMPGRSESESLQRSDYIDSSVRFTLDMRGDRLNSIKFDAEMAAAPAGEGETIGVDNVYATLDRLHNFGIDKNVPVNISAYGQTIVNTTVKHLPGYHNQKLHAGSAAGRGQLNNEQLDMLDRAEQNAIDVIRERENAWWNASDAKRYGGITREDYNAAVGIMETTFRKVGHVVTGTSLENAVKIGESGVILGHDEAPRSKVGTVANVVAQKKRDTFDAATKDLNITYATYTLGMSPYGRVNLVMDSSVLEHSTATDGDTLDQVIWPELLSKGDVQGTKQELQRAVVPGSYAPRLLAGSMASNLSVRNLKEILELGEVPEQTIHNLAIGDEPHTRYIEVQMMVPKGGVSKDAVNAAVYYTHYPGKYFESEGEYKRKIAESFPDIPIKEAEYGHSLITGFEELPDLAYEETTEKHLAGQHNQLDHGRKRAGEQRRLVDYLPDDYMGSSSGLSKPIEPLEQNNSYDQEMIDLKAINNYFQDVSVHDASKAEEKSSWAIAEDITSSPVIDTAWPMLSQYFIDSWERKRWKNTVVTALSEDTGLDYDRVSDLVKTWSDTSNDNNPTSLGLQMAAHEEFGTPLTDWQQEKINSVTRKITLEGQERDFHPDYVDEYNSAREDGRKFLRAMYDRTQKEFEAAGIENVLLYRGAIRIEKGTEPETWPKLYDQQELEENAMESWSLSFQTASSFAHSFEGIGGHGLPGMEGIEGVHFQNPEKLTEVGVVYQAVIPRERILCTPKTGMGCLSEFEFVVLGSDAKDEARVVGRYQGD